MFFEGAEKRIYITCKNNVRKYYNSIWWNIHIKDIGCNILSMIHNKYYDIYLLSESILLVSKNTILIKTCGITSPLNILNLLDITKISNIIYSHPNFLRINEQPILYQNPNTIINYINDFIPLNLEYNKFEFLNLISNNLSINHNELILWDFIWDDNFIWLVKKYLVNWQIDDFIFEPQGYSLNGCKDEEYITIHCTPNKECAYISIEFIGENNIIPSIIKMLKPKTLGLVTKNKMLFDEIILEKNYKFIYTNNIYIKYYA
jgi:S-adenosylmethionine decarboxylase